MSVQSRRTLAAALATSLALAAIFPVVQGGSWFWRVWGAVAVVAAAGLVTRRLRVPRALQPLVALVALGLYLPAALVPDTFAHGLPTSSTLDALRALVTQGRADLDRLAPPVPARPGTVLLVAAGVGLVALVVDLVAVVLDRVAVAGLPLLVLFAVPSAVLPGGLGGWPFAIAATGWLVLLLEEGSDTVARWGAPLRAAGSGARPGGDDPGLGQVGRRIGVAALGAALVVPAVVPDLDARLLGGGRGGGGEGEGPSAATTYNPITRLRDQLVLPEPRQLFVYSTDDPTPDYLRMTTLDVYTGNGWASSKLEASREDARVQDGIDTPAGVTALRTPVTTRIAVDDGNLDVHWLPVPFGPRRVDVAGTWLWDRRSETVFSASRTTRQLPPYTVDAEQVELDRDLLAGAIDRVEPSVAERYANPLGGVSASVTALARSLTRGATTKYERAVRIQTYFTSPPNGFVYDFTPSQPRPGQDPLDAFLEGKHGFCEQYATAMAVLLREAGLPSRVAVGFTPGRPVPGKKGIYSVTTSEAHAWPEAWFDGAGWVRFEPTPSASQATQPSYTLPETTVVPGDTPSEQPRPTPTGSAFPRGFQDPDTLLDRPTADGGTTAGGSGSALPWLLLLLGAAALVTPGLLGLVRRRRRGPDPESAWAQLEDDVTDTGGRWLPAESPRATAQRLAVGLPESVTAALDALAEAVELARYAPPGRATTRDLRPQGQAVRHALRAAAPRTRRWRSVLAPPSALRWGAHVASERVADVLDAVDRVVSALTAPVRRVTRLRQG